MYVGIDIIKDGNIPASSKYQTTLDWGVLLTEENPGSFIGLMLSYN